MTENRQDSLILGGTTGVRRIFHVTWVSLYLSAVGIYLLATFKVHIRVRWLADAIARQIMGTRPAPAPRSPTAPAMAPTPVEAPVSATTKRRSAGSRNGTPPDWAAIFACPKCRAKVEWIEDWISCTAGHSFPVIRNIPRFVDTDSYVHSFSLEWNTHSTTQLDSRLGSAISEQTLREKTGLEPKDVAGQLILDAGVGTGRFTEVLTRWGARVVGVDLSLAVEAAARNLENEPQACVAQADIMNLPFAPSTFDLIISIGVLHHTPDTRRAFEALVPLLKPGGTIAIWVYPDAPSYRERKQWIPFTSRIPPDALYDWCKWFVPLTHLQRTQFFMTVLYDIFPFSRQGHGLEWDILDTFDGYSPRFHGIHTPAEARGWFEAAGLVEVKEPGPVQTSMRGRAPDPTASTPPGRVESQPAA